MPPEVEPARVPVLTEVVELDLPPDDAASWPPPSPMQDATVGAASPGDGLAGASPDASTPQAAPWTAPDSVPADGPVPEAAPAPTGPAPVEVDAVVQQVLQRLGPQFDDWLDRRWQAAVAPALQRGLDELRASIAPALRDWVADAVREALRAPAPGTDPGHAPGD